MSKRRRLAAEGDCVGDQVLARLLHVGGISNVGLSELLSSLKSEYDGLDVKSSVRSIAEVNQARFAELRAEISLPLSGGGEFCWELLNPNKLLSFMVDSCPSVAGVFREALARTPPRADRPWSLIVGFDEFAPGNKLRVDNSRKCMNLSFSFRELGQAALCSDVAWFTPVCIRSHILSDLAGGWPHAFREYLKLQLLGVQGLQTAGVPVVVDSQPVMVFARLTNVLTDGDGFRVTYDWRGHASLKPCLQHYNVLKKEFHGHLATAIAELYVKHFAMLP